MSELLEIIQHTQNRNPQFTMNQIVRELIEIVFTDFDKVVTGVDLPDLKKTQTYFERRLSHSRSTRHKKLARKYNAKLSLIDTFYRIKSEIAIIADRNSTTEGVRTKYVNHNAETVRSVDFGDGLHLAQKTIDVSTNNTHSQGKRETNEKQFDWKDKIVKHIERRISRKIPVLSPNIDQIIGLVDEEPHESHNINSLVVGNRE